VLDRARRRKARAAVTDLQKLNAAQLEAVDAVLISLGKALADQLGLEIDVGGSWSPRRVASVNFDRFMKRHVLETVQERLVSAIDEADRLFPHPFASEVFGLR